jgi:predicted LPLAT superfamily acyltransferase
MRIAIRCKAPVLQAFILPHKRLGYKFDVVGMLIDPVRVDDEDAAVAEAMRVYAYNLERYVRAAPWLMTRI